MEEQFLQISHVYQCFYFHNHTYIHHLSHKANSLTRSELDIKCSIIVLNSYYRVLGVEKYNLELKFQDHGK